MMKAREMSEKGQKQKTITWIKPLTSLQYDFWDGLLTLPPLYVFVDQGI